MEDRGANEFGGGFIGLGWLESEGGGRAPVLHFLFEGDEMQYSSIADYTAAAHISFIILIT